MTGFALDRGMSADQWETILMTLNRLERHLPAQHRVALSAVRAEFSAMNIRVAVRAIPADVGKDRLHMALRAGDFLVHPAKRIPCLAMVEFGNRANRPPACVGVTVFAGDREGSMRTSGALPLCTNIGSGTGLA